MNSYAKYIETVIEQEPENKLLEASILYQKSFGTVPEMTYYKTLERMSKQGSLVHLTKGLYYRPKKSRFGTIPISEKEIIGHYTNNGRGIVIGYRLYNQKGLTTQISKRVEVLSSAVTEQKKNIQNVCVTNSGIDLTQETIPVIETMEILQNYKSIEDIRKSALAAYMSFYQPSHRMQFQKWRNSMNLHEHKEEFEELIAIVADYIGVPADAVRRDYYIVQMMQNLQNSEYTEACVFKGGTSLSKCYPGSINRFSEDIDLTFIPVEDMTNKKYSKALKRVEDTISAGFLMEKIEDERNDRNKSAFVWPENESKETCRVKLEIGSSVRPDPFSKRSMKTYIQEYLEEKGMQDVVTEFDLQEVKVNTLDITRTFLDKVMSVKRHAICGTLPRKVRHIYDVTVLLDRSDIQDFLNDTERLKQLLKLTKETDSFYLQKRNISEDYDPLGAYAFENWKQYFNDEIRGRYETLHEDLLYTSNRQSFEKAIQAFEFISHLFASIGE